MSPTAKDPRVTVRIDVEDYARLVKGARRAKMALGPFIVQQAVTHTAQQALRQDVPVGVEEAPGVTDGVRGEDARVSPGPVPSASPELLNRRAPREPGGMSSLGLYLAHEHEVPLAVARRWLARGMVRVDGEVWRNDRIPSDRLESVVVER